MSDVPAKWLNHSLVLSLIFADIGIPRDHECK
jgi:hypothetical protein